MTGSRSPSRNSIAIAKDTDENPQRPSVPFLPNGGGRISYAKIIPAALKSRVFEYLYEDDRIQDLTPNVTRAWR